MKKIFLNGLLIMAGLVFFQGCSSPQLAQTPLGQDEVKWEGFIKSNYPEWEAPQMVPPSAVDEPSSLADIPALPPLNTQVVIPEKGVTPGIAQSYTVEKGDSLWKISKKFYGKGSNWQIILDANKDKIPDPNRLKSGVVLSIPTKP